MMRIAAASRHTMLCRARRSLHASAAPSLASPALITHALHFAVATLAQPPPCAGVGLRLARASSTLSRPGWSEIPVKIQTIMEYDVVKARARVVPFRIERLPLSYLKDGA